MKRRLLLVALATCLIGGSGLIFWNFLVPFKPGVTAKNFCRLHEGMTQAEVEVILGQRGTDTGLMSPMDAQKGWAGEEGRIYLNIIHYNQVAYSGAFFGDDGLEAPHQKPGPRS